VAAHVLVLTVQVHVRDARSLKEKRSVVKSIVDGARARYRVAAAETGHQDTWQRAELTFACVSGSSRHATEVIDEVERFAWSFAEVDVLSVGRRWLEDVS